MAKKKIGKPFEKGKSGNPSGRPALTPEEKAIKVMTREMFAELQQKMMTMNRDELETLLAGNTQLPYEEELFLRHMLALGEEPDMHQYQKYLDRRVGKVADEIGITYPKPLVIERLDGTEIVVGTERDRNGNDGTETSE